MSSSGDGVINIDVMLKENRATGASFNIKLNILDEMIKLSLIANIKFAEWSGFIHMPNKNILHYRMTLQY